MARPPARLTRKWCGLCLRVLLCLLASSLTARHIQAAAFLQPSTNGTHTSSWAVLVRAALAAAARGRRRASQVCSSRFWFNYRHVANTLSMYHSVKRLGIPDSHIILMLADDAACNARNPFPGRVFGAADHAVQLYGPSVEVDYRGSEVSVESLLRLLTGRHEAWVPRGRRLLSDADSNVLVYLTGHGGAEFLKFQDAEEVSSTDLAEAVAQMAQKRRFRELLFMADTCQAATLAERLRSPGVVAVGSSARGEPSWSYEADAQVGLTGACVLRRRSRARYNAVTPQWWTASRITPAASWRAWRWGATPRWRSSLPRAPPFFFSLRLSVSLTASFRSYDPRALQSTAVPRTELFGRPLSGVRVTDFLGSVPVVELTPGAYPGFGEAAEA